MIKVLVVEQDSKTIKDITEQLVEAGDIEATVERSVAKVESVIAALGPAVIVVGPSLALEQATDLAQRLASQPGTGLILVTGELTTDVMQRAVRGGFRDVVNDAKELAAAIRRTNALVRPDAGSTGGQQPVARRAGRVVTFFGTKGGVGKTVFATNTAIGLARAGYEVVLLDLDHQFGDVGVMLGLRPERTIADLIPVAERLDGDMLEGFLSRHESGAKVLLAPAKHESRESISTPQLQRLFEVARSVADYVVVDTPASFADNALTILDSSDCLCLVATLDVPSVKNTQIVLQTLQLLKYPEAKIKVLLNRADSKVSLLPDEVERHLKHSISVQVPSDRAVPRSVNEGRPLLMDDERTAVAKALGEVVGLAAAQPGVRRAAQTSGVL